jgi:hypothetical protein
MTFTFDSTDARFPCIEPFILEKRDRVVVYQGSGTAVCSGPVRELYLGLESGFLQRSGDDMWLKAADGSCRDYMQYENGTHVDPIPADCPWSGPNPSNGDVAGVSVSRFDQDPFADTDSGADWEASGATTTTGDVSNGMENVAGGQDTDEDGLLDNVDNCDFVVNPAQTDDDADGAGNLCDNCIGVANPDQADADEDGLGDACDTETELMVVDQDIRSTSEEIAQHRQQPASRIGVRGSSTYRVLGWVDVSRLPEGAIVDTVSVVYYTTSGDPLNINENGDTAPEGPAVTAELHELLRPWNSDEPLTYPEDLGDNQDAVAAGDSTWRYSTFPDEWSEFGGCGATDSGAVLATVTVPQTTDSIVEFSDPALVTLMQDWLADPSTNNGFLIKAADADELAGVNNRKVLCGKGFPLETSTNLTQEEALSHRPKIVVEFHLP